MANLTHIDREGRARMVDVSNKRASARTASAKGTVFLRPETVRLIAGGKAKKGDVLGVARLAGIMAAKRTADLIPLCHSLELDSAAVDLECDPERGTVEITARCRTRGRTGVEMEALTAVSVAALTVYDMVKAVDRGARIGDIRLVQKAGGKSGTFEAS
ncbi:MAG: cyclic pyranopterin monophosphate synthase MoaC [Rhodospirillales bacterium]|nr:cyclic pyranopterin monophosphate synthase MoaC [Rhodospirillales bacterium]MDP6805441.1 cyclic pyranopterin monophosphate synthase MoaC [Rhodospirillales bacterium]